MTAGAAEAAPGAVLLVESTKAMELDIASVSPDGYSLDRPNYQDGGLMGGLFGGGLFRRAFDRWLGTACKCQ